MYALMYSGMKKNEKPVLLPAIISLQKISEGPSFLTLPEGMQMDESFYKAFSEQLESLLEEIFNEELPFHPCESAEVCQYCDYLKLCARYSV